MSEPSCSRETIADCAALEIVHRPDEREWLRGVRTRNRVGGNQWEGSRPTERSASSWSLAVGQFQSSKNGC